MSQANKQLVLQALHALDRRDSDTYAELHHPDYVNHEAAPGRQRGAAGARATAAFLNSVFEDLHQEPLDVVAERDLVVIRLQASARQVGEIDGLPATGRTFSVQHIHVFRVTDGKISEHWACRDDLGAARQTGAIPEPGRRGRTSRRAARRRDPEPSTAPVWLGVVAGPWMQWFWMPLPRPRRESERGRR